MIGHFRRLWRGELPLERVFWTDTILVGTLANLAATVCAVLLYVAGASTVWVIIVHFGLTPYNVLLYLAVWQSAAREASKWSFPAQAAALVWLVLVFVL